SYVSIPDVCKPSLSSLNSVRRPTNRVPTRASRVGWSIGRATYIRVLLARIALAYARASDTCFCQPTLKYHVTQRNVEQTSITKSDSARDRADSRVDYLRRALRSFLPAHD